MNPFTVEFTSGTVVGSQKHTQSQVVSEGGGGYIGPLGGRVKAPQVKSYNTTRHDIFLRLQNGQEINVFFSLDNISVREGHRITLLAVFRHGVESGCYARLFNHDTRLIYNTLSNEQWHGLVDNHYGNLPVEPQQVMSPETKEALGFYQRVVAAVQYQVKGLKIGWDAGTKRNASVVASELEEVIQEALVTVGNWQV